MIDRADNRLNELESDALTELVNIGVSRAAVALRGLVGEQVLLSVPSLSVLSRAEAAALLERPESHLLVAIRQAFHGEFSGRALLIFPEANSLELVRAVARGELELEDIIELEQEALAEIGNIILNGCMATVASLLQRRLTMSLPEVIRGRALDFFEVSRSVSDDVVLFVHINFALKEREISGYIAMVMDFLSIATLKTLVGEFIQRSTG